MNFVLIQPVILSPPREAKMKKATCLAVLIRIFGLLVICVVLTGCGGIALNHDYYDYSDVYGKSVNKQLLLNLARLSRDEPPYFLQLSGFSAQHTLTGGLGLGNKTTSLDRPAGLTELDGTANIGGTEQPIFQFVPLTGDPFAQAFTSPLNTKIFYTFYDQNVPADMLARTMIQSVDVEILKKDEKTGKLIETDPPTVRTLVNNPLDSTYRDFLVWCYILRTYQMNHELIVRTEKPLNPAKTVPVSNVDITSFTKAIDYGLTLRTDTNRTSDKDYIYKTTQAPTTNSPPATASDPRPMAKSLTEDTHDTAKPNYVTDAFIVEPHFVASNVPTQVPGRYAFSFSFITEKQKNDNVTSRAIVLESIGASDIYRAQTEKTVAIRMRTFYSVMQGLAKEQEEFAEAAKQDSTEYIVNNLGGRYLKSTWTKRNNPNITPICASPLLILQSDISPRAGTHEDVLTAINYSDLEFKIADQVDDNNVIVEKSDLISSNRQVFGLVSYLYNLITIDPKKLPVQQLIQVQ